MGSPAGIAHSRYLYPEHGMTSGHANNVIGHYLIPPLCQVLGALEELCKFRQVGNLTDKARKAHVSLC